MWLLTVHCYGKRWRKFFRSAMEANVFDVVEWLHDKAKSESLGDDMLHYVGSVTNRPLAQQISHLPYPLEQKRGMSYGSQGN